MDTGYLEAVDLQPEPLFTGSGFGNSPLTVVQFIRDVRALPSIWGQHSPKYDMSRRQSWITLCRKYFPHFDNRSEIEKTFMVEKLKCKWKSLRDRYIREVSAMKNPNSKRYKSRKCKRPYVYFDNLSFLSNSSKGQHEHSNEDDELNGAEDDAEDDDSEHKDYSNVQHWIKEEDDLSRFPEENQSSREESAESHQTLRTTKETPGTIYNKELDLIVGKALRLARRSFKRFDQDVDVAASSKQKHDVPARTKKRKTINQHSDQSSSDTNKNLDTFSTETVHDTIAVADNSDHSDSRAAEGRCCSYFCEKDEDRLFLLSLVSELKQVPKDLKLDAKMDIMNVIKTYKSKVAHNKMRGST